MSPQDCFQSIRLENLNYTLLGKEGATFIITFMIYIFKSITTCKQS